MWRSSRTNPSRGDAPGGGRRTARCGDAGVSCGGHKEKERTMKSLNIGLIGYGFMGRTHSNAYRRVNNFFDVQYRPVLKAVSGRDAAKVKQFAEKWRSEERRVGKECRAGWATDDEKE